MLAWLYYNFKKIDKNNYTPLKITNEYRHYGIKHKNTIIININELIYLYYKNFKQNIDQNVFIKTYSYLSESPKNLYPYFLLKTKGFNVLDNKIYKTRQDFNRLKDIQLGIIRYVNRDENFNESINEYNEYLINYQRHNNNQKYMIFDVNDNKSTVNFIKSPVNDNKSTGIDKYFVKPYDNNYFTHEYNLFFCNSKVADKNQKRCKIEDELKNNNHELFLCITFIDNFNIIQILKIDKLDFEDSYLRK
ncbi:hypothetical protein DMUE_4322 [Dictyocoela muelleri]|nr:hypothetical protein DMUE_4322 [Dictyocoela muelleri]